jgi:hypothetical protein
MLCFKIKQSKLVIAPYAYNDILLEKVSGLFYFFYFLSDMLCFKIKQK